MKKKVSEESLNKVAVFTLVIMVLFMSIVAIELIVIIYSEKINVSNLKNRETTTTTSKVYVDDGVSFKKIDVTKEPTYVNNICKKGCKLVTNELGVEYKFIIEQVNDSYVLSVVSGKKYLLVSKNIGDSLENTYFMNYLNYVVVGTIVENDQFKYDYAVVLDNKSGIDIFESLDKDEMLFTNEGIIYYYDQCVDGENNAMKVQARRYPFAIDPVILDYKDTNYTWCD